jgi:hypothetical protein
MYGLCRLLANGPGAVHLLVAPVMCEGETLTFTSLVATENTTHSKAFTKNPFITRGSGL